MNVLKTPVFIFILILAGCTAGRNAHQKEVKLLQKGKIKEDTSFVYMLPYEKGSSHLLIQGYYSTIFSHRQRAALDFEMKRGTKILAARDGVVIRAREDNTRGGWSKKFRQYANFVIIQHPDGTRAGYWHLQQNGVLVNIGDTVRQGQVIALSGKTGYSATPHLHFIVWNNNKGQWHQVATRFQTQKGPKYLRPFKKYKNK